MFWLLISIVLVMFVIRSVYIARQREKRLSEVPLEVRQRFEAREKFREEQEEIKRQAQAKKDEIQTDAELSLDVKNSIEVAQAEGRSYTRVWVSPSSIDSVKRWAARNHIRVISVKAGNSGDIKISVSGFKKDQRLK